jgi:hypothetical protein
MPEKGSSFTKTTKVPPSSRKTIHVNDASDPAGAGPGHTGLSTRIDSDTPIIAERPMYFNIGSWNDGHDVVGVTSPDRGFYFAEGNTISGFDEYLCIQNPDPTKTANIAITYMPEEAPSFTRNIQVPASSRKTIHVNNPSDPGGAGGGYGALSCIVGSDIPIIVERPMYFNLGSWNGGHTVAGTVFANQIFYFAEGTTQFGFDEFICILNPDLFKTANVTIDYMPEGFSPLAARSIQVPPASRKTVYVNKFDVNTDPGGAGQGFTGLSTRVLSDIPIIAERPMYFNLPTINLVGGHNVMGYAP